MKQSRPSFHQLPLEFCMYPADPELCPVNYITTYLSKTKLVRYNGDKNFFISYTSPHKSVSSTTIARWVTDILSKSVFRFYLNLNLNLYLNLSQILSKSETTTFTAHSTRSASSSKAAKSLSLAEIAKAAGWSNVSTLAKFYNRPIKKNFGSAVLDNI